MLLLLLAGASETKRWQITIERFVATMKHSLHIVTFVPGRTPPVDSLAHFSHTRLEVLCNIAY